VRLEQYWDYGNASEQSNNLRFYFSIDVKADSSVEKIEFLTAGGRHVVMTNPEFGGENWRFKHDFGTDNQSDLANYGDGLYQMTVFYYVGDPIQTTIEYSGLTQPTQKPVPVYPEINQAVTSPVAFEWEPYLGSAANNIFFDVLDLQGNEVIDTIDQPNDATSTDDVFLNAGSYVALLGFENDQPYTNSDGIRVSRWKTSLIEWNFTVLEDIPTPTPDIKANTLDGPITISTLDTLSVTVALQAGNFSSINCDWWCAAQTPWDWYSYDYDSDGWIKGLQVTYMGPCANLTSTEVLNMKMPVGDYIFYFGVDDNLTGTVDGKLYYDRVDVTVEP
jgi:hypothetical protein